MKSYYLYFVYSEVLHHKILLAGIEDDELNQSPTKALPHYYWNITAIQNELCIRQLNDQCKRPNNPT